jgi:uncharacterized small protein (DUF1192 family)
MTSELISSKEASEEQIERKRKLLEFVQKVFSDFLVSRAGGGLLSLNTDLILDKSFSDDCGYLSSERPDFKAKKLDFLSFLALAEKVSDLCVEENTLVRSPMTVYTVDFSLPFLCLAKLTKDRIGGREKVSVFVSDFRLKIYERTGEDGKKLFSIFLQGLRKPETKVKSISLRDFLDRQENFFKVFDSVDFKFDSLRKVTEFYNDLIDKYVAILLEEEKLDRQVFILHQLLTRCEESLTGFNDVKYIGEVLNALGGLEEAQNFPEIRQVAYQYRDLTVSELKQKIKDLAEEITKLDANRNDLHKAISKFATLYLSGRNKLEVNHDISLPLDIARGEVLKVNDRVYCRLIKKDSDFVYEVELGSGENYTSGSRNFIDDENSVDYGDEIERSPAPNPNYQSFIDNKNSIEDDQEIADKITKRVAERFPSLNLKNDVGADGSFHECFQGWSIFIDSEPVHTLAKKMEKKDKEVLTEVLDIFREVIESSKKK